MSKEPKAPMKSGDPQIEEPIEINGLTLLIWGVRLSAYFLALGGMVLLAYVVKGFGTAPASFPLGFRIDPMLAGIYLVLGAVGTLIGFFMQRYALRFVPVFALVMTALALAGTFGRSALSIQLSLRDTIFHWCAAILAWALWFYARGQARKRLEVV